MRYKKKNSVVQSIDQDGWVVGRIRNTALISSVLVKVT